MTTDIETREITSAEVAGQFADAALAAVTDVSDPAQAERLLAHVHLMADAVRLGKLGQDQVRRWAVVTLRAERKFGELLGPAAQGGDRRSDQVTSANLTGADRVARNAARKVAAVPEAAFEAYVTDKPSPTRSGLLRKPKQPKTPGAKPAQRTSPGTRPAVQVPAVIPPAPLTGKEKDHAEFDARVRPWRDAGLSREQIATTLGDSRSRVWDSLNRLEGEDRALRGCTCRP